MKKLLFVFILVLLANTSYAIWPFPSKKPEVTKTSEIQPAPQKPTVSGGRDILNQLKNELLSAKQENIKLKASLDKIKVELQNAYDETVKVQKEADALKEWGIVQQAEKEKYIAKYNASVKRYHRLKMIVTVIIGGVGAFIGLQFMSLVPPPYNIAVPVGAAGLFAALSWFIF